MIDWHSHVLPGMDDGSRDVDESKALLKALWEQGVRTVIATPHFYANDESVDTFLRRRKGAYSILNAYAQAEMPRVLCGAEVRYYSGISRLEGLHRLCIEDTKLLLLEMSECEWPEYTLRELEELAGNSGMTVILAHVERYLKFQSDDVWRRLSRSGVLLQINASFINSLTTRRKALSLLKSGMVQFIGSDCHNVKDRPPHIGKAFHTVQSRLGDRFYNLYRERAMAWLTSNYV